LFFFFFYYNKNPSTEEKTLARNDDPKMTQKSNQFKGQQKRKTIAPNRHGKSIQTRKGIHFFFTSHKSLSILISQILSSSCSREEKCETNKDDERDGH